MVSRSRDWMKQALRDLAHVEKALEDGYFEWACFSAQQAAEMAVKALYQNLNVEAWGHSVSRMLELLPDEFKSSRELIDKAKELDRHYIPMRYPNFHSEGAPMNFYTREDALRAVNHAREIIEFCRSKIV